MDNRLVVVKCYNDGIVLRINPDCNFGDVLQEIADNFEKSRKFFGDAALAITIEGRKVSEDEEKQILRVISDHSNVNIICIVGVDEERNKKFIKAVKRVESQRDSNNCRYIYGNIETGESLDVEGNLVLLGNVCSGAYLNATKDIVVIGDISGSVTAGFNGDGSNIIIARSFDSENIRIGEWEYKKPKEKKLFKSKKKADFKIMYLQGNELIIDDLGDISKYVKTI